MKDGRQDGAGVSVSSVRRRGRTEEREAGKEKK